MRFVVDVEDFYLDGERGGLEEELKRHITTSVVSQIEKNLEKKINETVAKIARDKVSEIMLKKITTHVNYLIDTDKIVYDREEMKLSDYIKKQFNERSGWGSAYSRLEDLAKEFGKELKARYDKAFAAHIVDAMAKNQLLKDNAIVKLLEMK